MALAGLALYDIVIFVDDSGVQPILTLPTAMPSSPLPDARSEKYIVLEGLCIACHDWQTWLVHTSRRSKCLAAELPQELQVKHAFLAAGVLNVRHTYCHFTDIDEQDMQLFPSQDTLSSAGLSEGEANCNTLLYIYFDTRAVQQSAGFVHLAAVALEKHHPLHRCL